MSSDNFYRDDDKVINVPLKFKDLESLMVLCEFVYSVSQMIQQNNDLKSMNGGLALITKLASMKLLAQEMHKVLSDHYDIGELSTDEIQ